MAGANGCQHHLQPVGPALPHDGHQPPGARQIDPKNAAEVDDDVPRPRCVRLVQGGAERADIAEEQRSGEFQHRDLMALPQQHRDFVGAAAHTRQGRRAVVDPPHRAAGHRRGEQQQTRHRPHRDRDGQSGDHRHHDDRQRDQGATDDLGAMRSALTRRLAQQAQRFRVEQPPPDGEHQADQRALRHKR